MADKGDLFQISDEFKRQADQILYDSRIVELFSTYGEVKLVGSYPLNVMFRPDLDIYVLVKKYNFKKVTQIISDLISKNYFQQICFANWQDFSRDKGIKGYYLEPKINIGNNRWKLDIWFMTEDQYEPHTERFLDLMKKSLNPEETRQTILKFKDYFHEGEKYKNGVNGRMIYNAILLKGIKTPEELKLSVLESDGVSSNL